MKNRTAIVIATLLLSTPLAALAQSPQRATIAVWEKAQKSVVSRGYKVTPSQEGSNDAEVKNVTFSVKISKGLDYLFLIGIDGAFGMNIFVEDELGEILVENTQSKYQRDAKVEEEEGRVEFSNTIVRGVGFRAKYSGTVLIHVKPVERELKRDGRITSSGRYAYSALMGRRGTVVMRQFGTAEPKENDYESAKPTQN